MIRKRLTLKIIFYVPKNFLITSVKNLSLVGIESTTFMPPNTQKGNDILTEILYSQEFSSDLMLGIV